MFHYLAKPGLTFEMTLVSDCHSLQGNPLTTCVIQILTLFYDKTHRFVTFQPIRTIFNMPKFFVFFLHISHSFQFTEKLLHSLFTLALSQVQILKKTVLSFIASYAKGLTLQNFTAGRKSVGGNGEIFFILHELFINNISPAKMSLFPSY